MKKKKFLSKIKQLHLKRIHISTFSIEITLKSSQRVLIINAKMQRQLKTMINSVLKKIINNLKINLSAKFQEFQNFQKSIDSTKKAIAENRSIWNSNDIDFFDFNYEKKSAVIEEILTHSKKNIYYRNVHVFVKKIKKMIIVFDVEQIRRNLFSCLKDTTFMWHTTKLSNITRRILIYEKNVNEWITTLIIRFKFQTTTATTQFFRKTYIMKNVQKRRKFRKYAQKIIRWIKSTEMKSVFNQLNVIYSGIEIKLRRNFYKFINITTVKDFLQKFDACKNV